MGTMRTANPRIGYSHIKTCRVCCSTGFIFHKKSLNMGLIFYKNIHKHGSISPEFPKFSGVCHANTWGLSDTPSSNPNLSTPWTANCSLRLYNFYSYFKINVICSRNGESWFDNFKIEIRPMQTELSQSLYS